MLDVETVTPPTENGLNIVSLAEMKKHMRISHSALDDQITDAILEAADACHGRDGILNRTVFPMRLVRYLEDFPNRNCKGPRIVELPYPPLRSVAGITYDDGGSPLAEVDGDDYIVRADQLVGSVEFTGGFSYPQIVEGSRALGIVYDAGYEEYPRDLKRLIKILAAHAIENPEATINEPRQMAINRMVNLGYSWLLTRLKVPNSLDGWD